MYSDLEAGQGVCPFSMSHWVGHLFQDLKKSMLLLFAVSSRGCPSLLE